MDSKISKRNVISSLIWRFLERGGSQGIQFVVQIVLTRLLLPEDYGVIAIITVFTAIATIFVEQGFSSALIQKKNVDEIDFSSAFFMNLSLASILYIMIYFAAPFIAGFYGIQKITLAFRILSINLFFGSFGSIQNAIIARKMQFRLLFFRSIGALTVSGAIGIVMAYKGLGIWALVGQQVSYRFLVVVILLFTLKWRPRLAFSFSRIRSLFAFGGKILFSSLIDTSYGEIRNLVIGKLDESAVLGYYNRGKQFPAFLASNIDGAIQSVMFPVLSSHQDDKEAVKRILRRSIISSSFIHFPLMIGLAVIAKPLVILLMTEKWLPAVPFVQIFCLSHLLDPLCSSNAQAIISMGYSGTYLKLNLIRKALGIIVLITTAFWGVYAIAIGQALDGIIASIVNSYPNKKLLSYRYLEQIRDVLPSFLLSLCMGAIVYFAKFLTLPAILLIIIQVITGGILYLGLAWLFRLKSYEYLKSSAKEFWAGTSRNNSTKKIQNDSEKDSA